MTTTQQERFWTKVDATGTCWEWTGRRAEGYGRYSNHSAHRFAYESLVGPIPAGLQLDHLCRNRACVNPDHLEPVTAWENNRRSGSPAAMNVRKTHCRRGHEFTPENTLVRPSSPDARLCRKCHSESVTRSNARRRVTCPECGNTMPPQNLSRHRRSKHV